jgi:hypothetical protein
VSTDAICLAANSFENLSAGGTPERFDAAVFPHDTRADARSMAVGQKCCGKTCEAILDLAQVDGTFRFNGKVRDWLRDPSVNRMGSAVRFQRELGQAKGCWVDASRWRPGDPTLIASDMVELEDPAHVGTVVWVSDDGAIVELIEGGQPDKVTGEDSAILRKRRRVSVRGGRLYLDNRRVAGWLKAGALPCRP